MFNMYNYELQEENIEGNLELEKLFRCYTKGMALKRKRWQILLYQSKKLLLYEKTQWRGRKRKAQLGKILANYVSDKVLISRVYEEFSKFKNKNTSWPVWLSWLEHLPINWNVMCSVPGQNIFSYVPWPSVCRLWRNVYLGNPIIMD